MTQVVAKAQDIAGWIPAKVRGVIYTVLGALTLLEVIWDIVPEPLEGKLLASLSVLGFGLALGNTGSSE